MKIAIQNGLEVLQETLISKGYEVVPYRESGMDSNITIINNIDASYEEMEPVSIIGMGSEKMLVLNASMLSTEQVLVQIENFMH